MNGAEALVRTVAAAGVDVCFANPGTSEIPLVAAFDRVPGFRALLGLFEGSCTGHADGYGRMLDRPALCLLHHGPGFANGIANLHNARRAHSPLVTLVGDHPDAHLPFDAPLTSDIESLARPCSDWVRRAAHASSLASDAADAVAVAGTTPGQVATLVVPSDAALGDAGPLPAPRAPAPPAPVDAAAVQAAGEALRGARASVLLLGGRGLRAAGLRAAGRIAAATGCALVTETFPARVDRGPDAPPLERLPYFPEQVLHRLGEVDTLILAGCGDPVAFFSYPGLPSRLVPDGCTATSLAGPRDDASACLEALADALDAPASGSRRATERPSVTADGPLDPPSIAAALAATQPEGAIVMEEAATSGGAYFGAAAGCPEHTLLCLTGGAIGQGLPVATGAAVACPDRPVIAFQADGGGLYTLQSLWSQAREGLNVTNLICANRRYRILEFELARAGVAEPGPTAASLTDLGRPNIDWTSLARGFGVPGVRVETTSALVQALERSFAEPGPSLIEMLL